MLRNHAFWLLIAAGLTGCGASTSESSIDSDSQLRAVQPASVTPAFSVSPDVERLVYGNATKGPLIDATVELFAIDAAGLPQGAPLDSTQTDGAGDWQLAVAGNEPVLVRISGGSYVDEADTNIDSRRVVELTSEQFLESILLPGENTVAVTVFSQALIQKSRRETGQNDFEAVIANNRLLFSQAYGFDVLSVLPADPLAPSGSADSVAYAMSVGGVANAINALSIASNSALPEYSHILDVVEDLVDCRLDGLGIGAQQVINPALAGYQDLSLEQQVLRFRNNNFSAYERFFEPAAIDASRCDEVGGAIDTSAPQVVSTADAPFFEALSPAGVGLNDAQIDSLREQFVATDDRQGELIWNIQIPRQLAIGTTFLVASVKDAWGNRTDVDWQVQVGDTTPPGIGNPAPVAVAAQGDFTVVELQRPDVSDLVSSQDQIVVTSDAPAGFPVGQTNVTWTAVDAAGNIATTIQAVTINSLAPVTTPAPPVINVEPGGIDFSVFFNDPDATTLTYSATGLPPGSGLSIDPATGILSGTPTSADFIAQLIDLTVSATDGQNTVSIQTFISVSAPNTPPAFVLTQSVLTLDEDFEDQSILIQPLEVPAAEADQQVSYSIEFASTQDRDDAPFEVVLDADTLSLSLVAQPDANGDVTFSVVADDGQNELSEFVQSVSVSVSPVNDAPQLVGPNEPVLLTVGQAFELDLATRANDVDNELLVYDASQLPAAMSISPDGRLIGMALPPDALSAEIPIQLTARDGQNESVDFVLGLRVDNPDSDDDGLTDYREQLLGFNPQLGDSDGDGYGDSVESKASIDPVVTTVIFVGATGDDTQSGDSPATALASLSEAGVRLALLGPDIPVVILIEATAKMEDGIVLTGSNRTIVGSVNFTTLQSATPTPAWTDRASSITSDDMGAIVALDCQGCAVFDVRVLGGQGIQVSDSNLTLDRVQVVGAVSSDGGGLYIESSEVVASNMHLAANQAEQGGALFVDSNSQLALYDSVFIGNSAARSGGAVVVSNSNLIVRNAVFASNTAPTAAAVDSLAGTVDISNATVAYNQLKSLTSVQLFRCRNSLLNACNDSAAIGLRDSVLAGNRNAAGQTADLAGINPAGQGNLVEPGRGAGTAASELADIGPYAVGFSSSDVSVLNAGSRTSIDAGLEDYFSEVDSVFTDTGLVEPGLHAAVPLRRIDNYSANAVFSNDRALFTARAIDITLAGDGQQSIDADRRVSVAALSAGPHTIVISPGTVPGNQLNAKPAISLGDGRYRIWVSNSFNAGQDLLLVKLDDDVNGVEVSLTCDQVLCGPPDVTTVATGYHFLDDERVTIVSALERNVPPLKPVTVIVPSIPVSD